jgi:hypothetical protein
MLAYQGLQFPTNAFLQALCWVFIRRLQSLPFSHSQSNPLHPLNTNLHHSTQSLSGTKFSQRAHIIIH